MCAEIRVPLAQDRTYGPAQQLPFLGIDLCTVSMTAYLPLDKRVAYAKELMVLCEQRFVTKKKLKQIIGRLTWATGVVQGARPSIHRFIDQKVDCSMLIRKRGLLVD